MLTSSANQYLRPEYLTPLPTTLDAKKSPLALLAQTCSQIGADPPAATKNLLSDKSSKSSKHADQTREKASPLSDCKATFKPYESCLSQEKSSSPDEQQRSASSNSASGRSRTPGGKRCSSSHSSSSGRANTPQSRKASTPNGEATSRDSPAASRTSGQQSSRLESPMNASGGSPSLQQTKPPSYSPAGVLAMTDPAIKDLPLGTFRPAAVCSLPSSTSAYLAYTSQLPIDVMASSLMSQHHAALKSGLANPYLAAGYARMKPGQGAESLMGASGGVCRDSFCTGCHLCPHPLSSPANAANQKMSNGGGMPPTSCPAGCAQCDHKSSQAGGPVSPYGHLGAAAYAHAQLAALAAVSQLPYVCNWIAADSVYCGKRFSTSEELLQHLRSHTSISSNAGGTGGADPAALSSLLSPAMGLPPTHPLFSRTYPTPPLSPLATARYHPYGKPSPLLPPSLSSLGLPLPPPHPHSPAAAGLPPYFSPYSLYGGPRLGAASGMHP